MTARALPFARWCFAAAHVMVRDGYAEIPHSVESPGAPGSLAEHIDWDETLAFRRHLDSLGFGIAEAMDTAQRFALGWENAKTLIQETGRLELRNGFMAGAGSDAAAEIRTDDDLVRSVVEEAQCIREAGGLVIVLPLPYLSETGADAARYRKVYGQIIDDLDGPLFLHWLGEAFMPSLRGYFPGDSFFEIMSHDTAKVRGAKLSLLDAKFEKNAREGILPDNQIILTGDDFNFSELILGDDPESTGTADIGGYDVPLGHFSHALLGVFDGIAAPAAKALAALSHGDTAAYRETMAPCEELGRWIFQEPTRFYKSGLAFLAWLNGHQSNPMLLNHEERMRDPDYYHGLYNRAASADALTGAEHAAKRFEAFLSS